MSHEINSPRFVDARTGVPFLTLWDEQWDACVRWQGEGRFRFSLRNYARQGIVEAEVDLPARTWRPISPPGEPEPLGDIDRSVRGLFANAETDTVRSSSSASPGSGFGLLDVTAGVLLAALVAGAWFAFGK